MNLFVFFLGFEKDEFQDRVGWNCCRGHVKGEEATSNTKIVANMPAAAAAAAAATSTFAAIVITANIDQTFSIFFSQQELPLLVKVLGYLGHPKFNHVTLRLLFTAEVAKKLAKHGRKGHVWPMFWVTFPVNVSLRVTWLNLGCQKYPKRFFLNFEKLYIYSWCSRISFLIFNT